MIELVTLGTLNTKYRPEDEPRLVEEARLRPEAFAPLYDRYYTPIFRFVNKRFRDKDFAADVTQQVFLKAMLNLSSYQNKGFPFSSWLYRIAVNEMNMIFRKQKNAVEHEIQESDMTELSRTLDCGVNESELTLLLECLQEIDSEAAHLVELRFFDQMAFRDIAGILDITEAGAKMKLYRVLEKIKDIFEKKRNHNETL